VYGGESNDFLKEVAFQVPRMGRRQRRSTGSAAAASILPLFPRQAKTLKSKILAT
jgi:hypothetical protein